MLKRYYPQCPNCNVSRSVSLKYTKLNKFNIYFCRLCQNGFTHPVPQNISRYYHSNYWNSPGMLGKIKQLIFNLFQRRRKKWLLKFLKKGSILEIGAGEGRFGKSLGKNFSTTGVEFPNAKIENQKIIKVDYLAWKTKLKFDAIIFWESLEHVDKPQLYLEKSFKLLEKRGVILIELPRFDSLESRIFKNRWFHLDVPRHLAHLTDTGIKILIKRAGFRLLENKNVYAPEYTVWGFTESVLDVLHIKSTDYFKKNKFSAFFIILIPLLVTSTLAEIIFATTGESPIGFVAARKNYVKKG